MLSSHCLSKLHFINIGEATICSTQIFTVLVQENTKSLTDIAIMYSADTMREETKILIEDIGLANLTQLKALSFRMNRSYYMERVV